MRRAIGVIVLLAIGAPPAAPGQWTIAAEVGIAHFTGSSVDTTTTTDPAKLSPDRPTTVGLRVARELGRVRVGLRALYAEPGVAARKGDLAIVEKSLTSLFEAGLEASWRLVRLGTGGALRVEGGPIVDLWSLTGLDPRARAGAQAGLAWEWPVSGRLAGALRAGVALTPSVFEADDLPAELARRATWRRGVTIGLAYRL